jgi:hypothetical protein
MRFLGKNGGEMDGNGRFWGENEEKKSEKLYKN